MNRFWCSYKAEFMKRKHSLFFWLHVGIPIILVIILDLFYMNRKGELEVSYLFTVLFELVGFAYPLVIAVLCGLVTSQEEEAGQFQVILGKVSSKVVSYFSQLAMLLTMGFFSFVLAVSGFAASARWMLGVEGIDYSTVLRTSGLMFISVIFMYCLSLVLGYLFGIGICSLVGFLGMIAAALAETNLGDKVWMYLPWAWAIRIGKGAAIQSGLIWMGGMTFCILVISMLWFRNWEGRRVTG